MEINPVKSSSVPTNITQPQFKAQLSKQGIMDVLASVEQMGNYNPYEQIPKLYTILDYIRTIPGKVLEFKYDRNFENLRLVIDKFIIDTCKIDSEPGKKWNMLVRNFIEGGNPNITTHARMPKSVFDTKWFCENLNVTESDVYKLAYDYNENPII